MMAEKKSTKTGAAKIAAALFLLAVCQIANAQPFSLGKGTEIGIGAFEIAGEVFHNIYDFAFVEDDWNGKPFDKNDVNPFDRALMHSYSKAWDRTGDAMMCVLPAGSFLFGAYFVHRDGGNSELLTHSVMFAETVLVAHTLPHLLKGPVSRVRPYNYYGGDEAIEDSWKRSFFSGHTTMAFASATFASYTFCKWFPESRMKIPFAITAHALAAFTGASRILAGCHFATDVLVGAAVGSAVGFLVPFMHTLNAKNAATTITASPLGFSIRHEF